MTKKKQVKVNPDVIRERCRQARFMNKMNQNTAAQLMGYYNTATISKMESVSSRTSINLEFLINAALIYGVSLDYLCGISDYPERDPQSVEQMAFYSAIKQFMKKELDNLVLSVISNVPKHNSMGIANILLNRLKENKEHIQRLRELNPSFDDDLRGGAKYVKFLNDTDKDIKMAEYFIAKGDMDKEMVRNITSIINDIRDKQLEINYDRSAKEEEICNEKQN